jgi:hypothetical protein
MKLYGLRLLSLLNESKLFCHAAWELLLLRVLISTVNRFGFFRRGSIQIYIALSIYYISDVNLRKLRNDRWSSSFY